MKKVIRITESDLIDLIKQQVQQQKDEPVFLVANYTTEGYDGQVEVNGNLIGTISYKKFMKITGHEPIVGDEYDYNTDKNDLLFDEIEMNGLSYDDDYTQIEPELDYGFTQGVVTVIDEEEYNEIVEKINQ